MSTERITSIPVNYYKTRDGGHEIPVVDLRLLGHTSDVYSLMGVKNGSRLMFTTKGLFLQNAAWRPAGVNEDDLMIPPPEPVFCPLTSEDVPAGSDFIAADGKRFRYDYMNEHSVLLSGRGAITWATLMNDDWSILTTDMRKLPCKKEVQP